MNAASPVSRLYLDDISAMSRPGVCSHASRVARLVGALVDALVVVRRIAPLKGVPARPVEAAFGLVSRRRRSKLEGGRETQRLYEALDVCPLRLQLLALLEESGVPWEGLRERTWTGQGVWRT